MDHSLTELVHSYNKLNGVPIASYSTLFGGRMKFSVPASKFGEFFDKYCDIAYEDEKEDEGEGVPPKELCLAENVESKTSLPLIGNFVFKFQVEEGDEDRTYYCEDLPMKLVQCYQKTMADLLLISENMIELVCCVLEGHSYRKNEYVYINVRLQFPFALVDTKFIRKFFKPQLIKTLRQNKVSELFEVHPVGDWDQHIVDFDNMVPLYRSTSESQVPHLKLTHIYSYIEDEHITSLDGPEVLLDEVFNPKEHSFILGKVPPGSVPIERENGEDPDEYLKYWLPLFLSIHYWSKETLPKEVPSEAKKNVYEVASSDSDNPLRMAQNLLPLLSSERANKDYSWLDVGRVLFNITNGSDEGLNMWISFSARASVPGRDKGVCTYRYRELGNSNLTINTIAWYVKEDNPDAYRTWHEAWCQKAFNDSLTQTHTDVAKSLYRFFWLDFVYSNDTGYWYEYRGNHYYRLGKEPIKIRKTITSDFLDIFESMRRELTNKPREEGYNPDNTEKDYRIEVINKLVIKLKNETFRSTIIKSARDFFHVEEFEKMCDKNHFLTACKNCVLEVVDKRVRARPGKPEDFILKFSNIVYPFDYSWDSYWVKEVLYWFDKITVGNRDLKHYFLKRIASFLRGLNPEKYFDVWTNAGNGGKSMLAKTLQMMFGSYFIDFPVSLLTGGNGKNSSGPSPELAQAANARGAILSEPDDRETMKGGIIKRITGGDRIFTRSLNENGGSMELTFKTIMICNRIPDIANVDKALINRFVIMPFLGTFAEEAPESEEEQFRLRTFKIDKDFEAKIPELSRALLWVSVQYYHSYATEGLQFPEIVKEYIKKHWEDNDYYLQFISEKIEHAYLDSDKKEFDMNALLGVTDVYQVFQRWFKDYYPGINVPNMAQFKSDIEMSGRLGPCYKRNCWVGIKLNAKGIVPDLSGIKI